jgi:hypothetical protein
MEFVNSYAVKRFNHFYIGFLVGLILPCVFVWLYITSFYPVDISFFEILKRLYPGVLLGKLLLLSIVPDLLMAFVFYKNDAFRLTSGTIVGGLPFLIASLFML